MTAIATGATVVFFAYVGFDAVANSAEESKKPRQDLPIDICIPGKGSYTTRVFLLSVVMRLLTHNMLSCNIKGVTRGFPLGIEATRLEMKDADLNPEFLRHIFPKLEWRAFRDAAFGLGLTDLPEQVEPHMLEDDDFLRKFHHALLEVHIQEGALICPETGRRFPVSKGIPNMLLLEDEV